MQIEDMELLLDYKTGNDASLISFTQIVLIRTKNKERYKPVDLLVAKVDTSNTAFIIAVSDAMNGTNEQKAERDRLRTVLESDLEALGNGCIQNSGGDPTYVTDANFKLRSDKKEQSRVPLVTPEWDYLHRGTQSGTLKGAVKTMPKGVIGVLARWRKAATNDAHTYGNPTPGKRFLLEDLPTLTKVEVQVRYFGTWNRASDWTPAFTIEVI